MRILLADGQAKVRSALRVLLGHQPGIEIVGEAVDTTGVLDWVKATCPDAILLDWGLPDLPSAELLPLLALHCPCTRVIVLSSHPEAEGKALSTGAHAFVSKGDPPEALLAAIEQLQPSHF